MDAVTTPPRRHPRDIIEAVVANMRRNLERLKYSTLAPSRYTVYLHPGEFERLETIVPVLREQTIRALDEELRRINARPPAPRWRRRRTAELEPEVRNAATDWHVAFMADPDGDLKEGDVLVDSELLMPARPDLGVGEQTRRIAIVQSAQHATTIEHTSCRSSASSPSARRISPMRMLRFASTTYVFGQILARRSALSTTFGRVSIKVHRRSKAFGDRWMSRPWRSS